MKIILAHGVLGFGVLGPLEYFNGVAAYLEKTFFPDVKVATAHVNPVGSVAERADALARFIVHEAGDERLCVFAHSMGGLDVRFALSKNLFGVAAHVRTVVMIGTPHLGSPVADAIASGNPAALQNIPAPIRVELQLNQRALHDLTTSVATKADAAMADAPSIPGVPPINYVHVAGDLAAKGANASGVFRAVKTFFGVNVVSDGVVTMTSASTRHGKPQPVIVWPTDHAFEVGWDLDAPQPVGVFSLPNPLADRSHLARYEDLVRRCA
jgi:hypothetical protein